MNGISVVTQTMVSPRRFTCWTGREELKPAVQDLGGQLKPPARSLSSSSDEDGTGNSGHVPTGFLGERHNALTCRPFLTQRQYQRVPPTLLTQRDPIHRQTVQRSARLRSRLSYTRTRSADHMLIPIANGSLDNDDSLAVHVSKVVERSRDFGAYSHQSSTMSARESQLQPRPATTTGRYFNTSNGLRGRGLYQNRRPQTAGSWLASGLKIQSIKLQAKNDFGVKLMSAVPKVDRYRDDGDPRMDRGSGRY